VTTDRAGTIVPSPPARWPADSGAGEQRVGGAVDRVAGARHIAQSGARAPLLQQLQHAATDATRAAQPHVVWPTILDALLPDARTIDDDTYYGDIEELDQALLLVPEPGVDYWPWRETMRLALRWRDAYPSHAELAAQTVRRVVTPDSAENGLRKAARCLLPRRAVKSSS
jgi:hypothetical protein